MSKKIMGTTSRYSAASRLLAACAIAFMACKDKDHTDICIGPLCPDHGPFDHLLGGSGGEDGSGGSGASGGGGGAGGETGTGGSPDLDGGVDADDLPDATTPPPDATTPPPDADVDDPCSVAFLTPTGVDGGQLTLGAGSDVDGEACGTEFTISVSIASNASTVNLFVNDSPLGAQSVLSATTDIDVVLGNRGATPNTLRALAEMPNGDTCEAVFPGDILVDCDGPSCEIIQPLPATEDYLNASQDEEPLTADFQTTVVVRSEVAHAGETVRLHVDSGYLPDEVLIDDGGEGTATFDDLTLDEDLHQVQAECRDALGNVTLSESTVWNVDITPCVLSIDQIAGGSDPVTPADDLDSNPSNGIQVALTGSITGSDCVTLNVGQCGQSPTAILIDDLDPGPNFSVPVTLPNSTTTFSVCANVIDDADNASQEISRDVDVRTDAPQLEITSPDDLSRFNQAGGSGAIADANPATATCELSISVNCTEPNLDVTLLIDGSASGTATCTPQSGLPAPFLGVATFATVSLDSENGGAFTTLSATQDAPGLPTGTAPSITVQADCQAPACSITAPDTSLDFLNAAADSSITAGFQTSFVIASDLNSVGENARITFDSDSGTTLTTSLDVDAEAVFADVTLSEGFHSVEAECFDAAGNIGTSIETWTVDTIACTSTLVVAGGVTPITPGQDNDSGTADLQVDATGDTDGGDCTAARVGVCGSLPATFSPLDGSQNFSLGITLPAQDGTPDVCLEIEDQAGNIGTEELQVATRTSAPELAVATPADDTRFNRTGALGATVDLDLGTNNCEADIVINCTDVGFDVQLLINSTGSGTASCVAQTGLPSPFNGTATFSSVLLFSDNSGGTTTISARQSVPGLPTGDAPEIDVQPDCDAPACTITGPDTGLTFLNAAADSSGTAGFQATFTVQGDIPSPGADVKLTFDGNTAGALTTGTGGGGVATFTDVTVAEGPHSVEAECSDSAGNVTTSAAESWTVDTIACSSTLVVAGGVDPITTNHDLNLGLADLQVLATGETVESDCVSARVGVCLAVSGGFSVLDSNGDFSLGLTLASVDGATSACVEVLDAAGNVSSTPALLNVRVSPPVVVITSPADGATFNATSTCTQDIDVTCTDDGEDVDLYVDSVLTDTQVCTSGQVTFSVALPEHDDATTANIAVEQTADGLTSVPESIDVQADCNVPAPTFGDPTCPSQLALAGDDVDSGTAGLQYDVVVLNDGGAEVTLTVTRGVVDTDSTNTGDLTSTSFLGADLGGTGSITLTACATDIHDNEGCTASCAITIAAEPTIDITSPTDGSTFTSASTDCDTNAGGLQVTVSGTTTAADGGTVQVTLGAANPATGNVSGGAWSACVPTLEGDNQTLTAIVTDVTTLTGSDSITVSVDATPSGAIAAPTFEVTGRREGTVDLTWLSVLDSGGDALAAYHVRCATTDIIDEPTWAAATIIANSITPSAVAGTEETLALTGVRTGTTRFCVVRGEDDSANMSPIAALLSAEVTNPFLQQQYSVVDDANVAGSVARISVEPLGDINGDGVVDFGYGATNRVAQIYFGKTTLGENALESADVTLTFGGGATNTAGFGSEVAGLGDINDDSIPDFALGAPGAGNVFVFFGRDSGTPWPASIDVDNNAGDGCEADLCFSGPASTFFGWDVHSANFDNAGPNDLMIAARTANTNGQVFIVLGGTQLATSGTTITLQNTTPGTNTVIGFLVNGPASNRPNFGFSIGSVGVGLTGALIGANGVPTGGSNAGGVYFVPTQATPGAGTGLTVLNTPTVVEVDTGTAANFGSAIRAIGDYDGNGFGDFIAGELFNTAGVGTLYQGTASDPSALTTQLSFTNDLGVDDNYASFIAAGFRADLGLVGDLDKDTFGDLLIGATAPDVGAPAGSRGSAQLFYGGVGALGRVRSVADFTYTSSLASGQVVPNYVGDINGDTYNDIAMLDSGTGANTVFILY